MIFRQLIDSETSTYTYLIADSETLEAVIIDPVLEQVERDTKLIKELNLDLKYILDTHVHADHITGSGSLRKNFNKAKIGVGIQNNLKCSDLNLKTGDVLKFGKYKIEIIETPGHTAGCLTYKINNKIFTGDLLLIRAAGRTDFQAGSSEDMFNNIKNKIYKLANNTEIYPGHDYSGFTSSTVLEEKKYNSLIPEDINLESFKKNMDNLKLAYPKKIDVSLPANKLCGE